MKLRYAYRIYPNSKQKQQMIFVGGACRYVFNYFLKENIEQYKIDKKFIWYADTCKKLVHLKKQNIWLNDVYSQVLQQSLKDLDQSIKNIKHGFGFPKFKSKYSTPISFRYQQNVKILNNKQLYLPKIGNIKIKIHRKLPNNYTGCTIYQCKTGKWFASFVIDVDQQLLKENINSSIGIDLNSEYTALSNGILIPNCRPLKRNKNKIKKLQQHLARTQKESKNRKKKKLKLAKAHEKIANQRKNDLHITSARIAKVHDLVVVETLKIKEMMKKSKSTAKAAADAGWGTLISFIDYKTKLCGSHMIKINQWLPSSKTCAKCGNKKLEIPLNIRTYKCDNCHAEIHRDINAATNIHNWGLQQWHITNKSGQELPKVPVDVICDILYHSDNGQTQSQLKQEATQL